MWAAQKWPRKEVRLMAIQAIGEVGRKSKAEVVSEIVDVLIGLLKVRDDQVMTESIVALQKMIVKGSDQSHAIIVYCVRTLDKISTGRAKATMIWLLK